MREEFGVGWGEFKLYGCVLYTCITQAWQYTRLGPQMRELLLYWCGSGEDFGQFALALLGGADCNGWYSSKLAHPL